LESLGVSLNELRDQERELLEALSPLVTGIPGGLVYKVLPPGQSSTDSPPNIQAVRGAGRSRVEQSRYAQPRRAAGSKRRVLRTTSAAWSTGPKGDENVLLLPVTGKNGRTCSSEVLLHLELTTEATGEQKMRLIRQLGAKYDELLELSEEIDRGAEMEELLKNISPRDLIFLPVATLLEQNDSR
jgi:hypothetical protein